MTPHCSVPLQVAHILETNGVIHFPDPYLQGFGWDEVGELVYPFKPRSQQAAAAGAAAGQQQPALTGLAAKTWFAGTEQDAPRGPDGKFRAGWHWGMPYTIKRDLPDWFMKEVERYAY
jgi:cell division protease FtsH